LELPPLLDAATAVATNAVLAIAACAAVTSPRTFVSRVSGASTAIAQLLVMDKRAITSILFISNSSLVLDVSD
jgi:hypothetical protein